MGISQCKHLIIYIYALVSPKRYHTTSPQGLFFRRTAHKIPYQMDYEYYDDDICSWRARLVGSNNQHPRLLAMMACPQQQKNRIASQTVCANGLLAGTNPSHRARVQMKGNWCNPESKGVETVTPLSSDISRSLPLSM